MFENTLFIIILFYSSLILEEHKDQIASKTYKNLSKNDFYYLTLFICITWYEYLLHNILMN